MVVHGIVNGFSFDKISQNIDDIKQIVTDRIKTVSPSRVTDIAHMITAINLEHIRLLLAHPDSWAFSLALDGLTYQTKSYFDVHIRLHIKGQLQNLHALVIPSHGQNMGNGLTKLVVHLLVAICPEWTGCIISISSDGAWVITGKDNGVVILLAQLLAYPVVFMWCGVHQLDLVTQKAMKAIFGGEFAALLKTNAVNLQ
ncbi:hypothetical protein LPJ71_007083 [Coemansia sp. S17]|nr:hypothetical protein LPJ71_007083 [Coemansia sp. S17]